MHHIIAIEYSSGPGGGTPIETIRVKGTEIPAFGPHQFDPFLLMLGRCLNLRRRSNGIHDVGDVRSWRLDPRRHVDRWLATNLGDPVADALEEYFHRATNIGKLLDGGPDVAL